MGVLRLTVIIIVKRYNMNTNIFIMITIIDMISAVIITSIVVCNSISLLMIRTDMEYYNNHENIVGT